MIRNVSTLYTHAYYLAVIMIYDEILKMEILKVFFYLELWQMADTQLLLLVFWGIFVFILFFLFMDKEWFFSRILRSVCLVETLKCAFLKIPH